MLVSMTFYDRYYMCIPWVSFEVSYLSSSEALGV